MAKKPNVTIGALTILGTDELGLTKLEYRIETDDYERVGVIDVSVNGTWEDTIQLEDAAHIGTMSVAPATDQKYTMEISYHRLNLKGVPRGQYTESMTVSLDPKPQEPEGEKPVAWTASDVFTITSADVRGDTIKINYKLMHPAKYRKIKLMINDTVQAIFGTSYEGSIRNKLLDGDNHIKLVAEPAFAGHPTEETSSMVIHREKPYRKSTWTSEPIQDQEWSKPLEAKYVPDLSAEDLEKLRQYTETKDEENATLIERNMAYRVAGMILRQMAFRNTTPEELETKMAWKESELTRFLQGAVTADVDADMRIKDLALLQHYLGFGIEIKFLPVEMNPNWRPSL